MAFRKLLLDTVDFYARISYPYGEKKNGLMIWLKIEDDMFVSSIDREIKKGKKNDVHCTQSHFELLPFKWGFWNQNNRKKNLGRHIGNHNNLI